MGENHNDVGAELAALKAQVGKARGGSARGCVFVRSPDSDGWIEVNDLPKAKYEALDARIKREAARRQATRGEADHAADARVKAKPPPWNRPITDADRRAARAAIEAERAGDDGAIFRFIDTPRKD